MRRSPLLWFAAASLFVTLPAAAATRPRYGGTLRVQAAGALASLDPLHDLLAPDAALRERVAALVFDRLVEVDERGRPQPALAVSWQQDADLRRWQFRLRPSVKLHSGAPLLPQLVATCLAAANPAWRVRLVGDEVAVESDSPLPDLLFELARTRYSVVARNLDGSLTGTGAFRVTQLEPGRRLLLAANDAHWAGRPFLDAVDITFSRALRDQAADLGLGRADLISVAPDQARRATQAGTRLASSAPSALVALRFSDTVRDPRLREAVSAAVDRAAIHNVLLQKQGEPAAGLLPAWVSGYAFLFGNRHDKERARQLRREAGAAPALTLAYDWSDPLGRAIAERVAVNARDVGITIQVFGENFAARTPRADIRLVRVPLPSLDPVASLAAIAAALGRSDPQRISSADSPEELYAAERALLQEFRLVPIVFVPEVSGLAERVKDWPAARLGGWPLQRVWVEDRP